MCEAARAIERGFSIMKPTRQHPDRACEFCGEFDHNTNSCPEFPQGCKPPRPRKPSFHRAAVMGRPERLEHKHDG
jgi:hypothetical protein